MVCNSCVPHYVASSKSPLIKKHHCISVVSGKRFRRWTKIKRMHFSPTFNIVSAKYRTIFGGISCSPSQNNWHGYRPCSRVSDIYILQTKRRSLWCFQLYSSRDKMITVYWRFRRNGLRLLKYSDIIKLFVLYTGMSLNVHNLLSRVLADSAI